MDKADIKQQALIFIKARNNLLAVIVFTVINIIFTVFDAGLTFLFSATLPQFVFEIGKTLDAEIGSSIFIVMGLVLAFIIIITYFVFWILSKRTRGYILVALIFFSIDSLVLLFLILSLEFNISYLLEIAFHGWVLYYLINGVKAWFKLRGVTTDVFITTLQEIKADKTGLTEATVSDKPNEEIEIIEDNSSKNE